MKRIKKLLNLVREIERKFPRTIVAFEGFVQNRERVINEPHVEVFNVPKGQMEAVESLVEQINARLDTPLTVLTWSIRESRRFFRKDVEALKSRNHRK